MKIIVLFIFVLPFCLYGCKNKINHTQDHKEKTYIPPSHPLFTQLPSSLTGIDFINKVEDGEKFNILTYRNFYNGGGVAIGDINNDGLADLYLTANMSKSKLYLNKGNWKFEDITQQAGVSGKRAWSTGVTMTDVNADGLLDIYVCNSGDVEGDNKENELYINQGDLTFKEEAAKYGLNDKGFSTHASFFDYDLDGDLDCYVLNNSFKDVRKFDLKIDSRNIRDVLGGDKLYRNDEEHFTDVSEAAGIYGSKIGFGLGITVGDVNNDMYPDIYISNDFFERDYLYINLKNGTFREDLINRIGHTSSNSMGADIADINNDGWADIFSTDMLPEDDYRIKTMSKFDEYNVEDAKYRSSFHYQYMQNGLQVNNGDGSFSELSFQANVASTDWSWGALIFDFENDGWKDLMVSNGIYKDITDLDFVHFLSDRENVKEIVTKKGKFDFRDFLPFLPSTRIPNYGFVNQRNLTFQNKAYELGLGEPSFSNGAAYGDLDNDGDLDLVINNVNMECFIYRNEARQNTKNNYIKFRLNGEGKNPFGVGTEIRMYTTKGLQVQQQMPARGFESSVEPVLNFGLEQIFSIDSLVVIWPNLKMQVLKGIKANQSLTLHQKDANLPFLGSNEKNNILYEEISAHTFVGNIRHKENLFVDFNSQRLMPKMLSTQGPRIIHGDVNGDELEDIFLAGARGDAGKIFIQNQHGKFQQLQQIDLEEDKDFEDAGAAFLDIDQDKDLDLLIGSGGNEFEVGSVGLAVRLYLNNGKGIFTGSPEKSPKISVNASCVKACDFDKDGDADVFIGGRSVPGSYGLNPRSYLLENDQGTFKDITPMELQQVGMVTDATWEDYDKDGNKDLVIVGEWMPITFFKNTGNNLQKTLEVKNSNGWWNVIKAQDLDNDGDVDFVAGNWGLNTKFKASPEKPITMYVNDFDQNGKNDFVITYYNSDGKTYPYHSKSDITTLMPILKKKFLLHKDYANKTYEQIFSDAQRKHAIKKQVATLETCILINNGNSNFLLQPLPYQAQISPVFGLLLDDIDQDNLYDIFMAGNFYGVKPEVGRSDASYGVMLKGQGNLHFHYMPPNQTGISVKGEVRDVIKINTKKKTPLLIFAKNNDTLQIFKEKLKRSDPVQ